MLEASSVASYDGSGGWFKIHDWGATISGGHASWKLDGSHSYKIPSCMPHGDCARIKVSGGDSASPAAVLDPGASKDTGYTANIYNGLTSYTAHSGTSRRFSSLVSSASNTRESYSILASHSSATTWRRSPSLLPPGASAASGDANIMRVSAFCHRMFSSASSSSSLCLLAPR
ncbi:endo-beta-1-4-glucanase D [Apiospora sp. TS-2023a]